MKFYVFERSVRATIVGAGVELPMVVVITPAQVRAARAMLDWSMVDLAKAAQVSVSTIKRTEDENLRSGTERSVILIQDALEAAGVRFLSDDGDGPGVRYKAR